MGHEFAGIKRSAERRYPVVCEFKARQSKNGSQFDLLRQSMLFALLCGYERLPIVCL